MFSSHNLRRLQRVSKTELPALAAHKFSHLLHQQLERLLYTPEGPRFPKAPSLVRPLGLFYSPTGTIAQWRERYPSEIQSVLNSADRAVERAAATNHDAAWNTDPLSGYKWDPKTFYGDIRPGQVPGADIRNPWELSRCGHFIALAQAYRLTGDEKYARAYVDQVDSWIAHNPPKFGVNWVCSMDVALRACNWIAAWDVFQNGPSADGVFLKRFSASLHEHGSHLRRHLEWGAGVANNHYLANLLGLFYIGLALDQRGWIDLAQREFAKELFRQTHADGFDYEGSICYHRLVLDIFSFYELVCRRNADRVKPLGPLFLERLGLMSDVLRQLSANDGSAPIIGDNDSGRVHSFYERDDADMAPSAFERAWLSGLDSASPPSPPVLSKGPSSSGLLTLRGANDLLVFCAAPNGTRGVGTHTHNDKLSFCLWINGEWFLSDPGTGVYTSDPGLRNKLRSTSAHNTVEVGGEEQNRIDPHSLFSTSDDAAVDVAGWDRGGWVEASHNGYRRLPCAAVHRRRIERTDAPLTWKVKDDFLGTGQTTLKWYFHAPPAVTIAADKTGFVFQGVQGKLTMRTENPSLKTRVLTVPFSPRYGVVVPASAAVLEVSCVLPASFQIEFLYEPR